MADQDRLLEQYLVAHSLLQAAIDACERLDCREACRLAAAAAAETARLDDMVAALGLVLSQ